LLPYNKVEFSYTSFPNWQNKKVFEGVSIISPLLLDIIRIRNSDGVVVKTYQCSYTTINNNYFLSALSETGSNGTQLNPISFQYGSNTTAQDVSISPSYSNFQGNNTYTGEVTGDGKQDVITAHYYIDNNGFKHYDYYKVIDNLSTYGGQAAISFAYTCPITNNSSTAIQVQQFQLVTKASANIILSNNRGDKNFLTSDYDNDSKQDVMMVSTITSGSSQQFNGIKINYSKNYNIYSSTYQPVDYPQVPYSTSYGQFTYLYNQGSYYIPGDFDGDGSQDYILILGLSSTNSFKAFFSSPAKNIFNQEIISFGVGGNTNDPFYATTVASTADVIPIDFDGDGKLEILVQKPGNSYVLSVFPLAPSTGYSYAASVKYTFTNVLIGYRVFPGDFNADGKTDLLVRSSANSSYGAWNILYSTGTIYKSYPFIFQNRPYLDGDNGGSAHHVVVADFNGDGKTDIWHALDESASTSKHTLFISKCVPLDNSNSASAFTYYNYYANSTVNRNQSVQQVMGDFNFDGKPDILSINGTSAKIVYTKPDKEENLMVNATNGVGAQTRFFYTKGTNRSSLYQHDNSSVPIGQGANGNPYTVIKAPMYLVNTLQEPNGIGGYNATSLQYEDAMFHPLRGFLGFKKVSSLNNSTGISSVSYSEMSADFFVPLPFKSTTDYYGTVLSETYNTFNLVRVNPGSASDKRYVTKFTAAKSFNYVNGSSTETTNTYDNFGNITNTTSSVGSFSGTTITPIETANTLTSYVIANTPVAALPSTTTVTKTRAGKPVVGKTNNYNYNAIGLLSSATDFAGTTLATTSTTSYDNFGNALSASMSAPNTLTPVITNTYDSKGRFLLSKSVAGSGVTKTETYTYNLINDGLSGSTSSDGLTSTYTYDGFGRLIQTNLPDGNAFVSSLAWEPTTGRYSVTNARLVDGGKWSKKYFDLIGRPIREESKGFNNQLIFSTTEYNQLGQVYKQAQPRYATEPLVEVTNTYDYLGRITNTTNGSTSTTTAHNLVTGGLFTTTVTNGASQATSKTFDASGKITRSNDNGGQLAFTYDSWGNQLEVKNSSISLIVNTYDAYGRQINLTDKNAGTIAYEYNALGKLTKQTDAKNNIHTFSYDAFGRLLNKTIPEGATTYTYYNDAATGRCNDNVVTIQGFGGDTKSFQYDNLQRLTTETTALDVGTYIKTYAYNTLGDLTSTTYPNGISINDTYNAQGILTQTSMTNAGVTQTLFTANAVNSMGVYTSYAYGNGKTSTVDYDMTKGVPTRYYTQNLQDLNLNFNANTVNLLSRQDAIKGLTETFTYDNLNRLTGAAVNSIQQFTMAYDGNSTNSLGNIQSKSDVGSYRYDAQKINAVRFITGNFDPLTVSQSALSVNTQSITYTSFLKAKTINENGYQITYTYGQDEQRIKSSLSLNGVFPEIKVYLGAYEERYKSRSRDEIIYVNAGNGLCAIIVKTMSGTVTPYFVYTDHLGNLLTLTNTSGTVVAEQNFDAWGRNRNPANCTYSGVPNNPTWLYRGYTGHEHVKEFALINMNGRIYDPVTCRMLSPDNYVPLPWNTQGYNRYGYANNNPLIYTDPDGNIFFVPILLAAAKGAVIASATYVTSNFIAGNTWKDLNARDWSRAAGAGALGGGIGGGFSLLGQNIGAFGQSVSYGIMQNMATQLAVDVAFGNKITAGSVFGAAIGGAIDGSFPQFKGIPFEKYGFGAALANAGAELFINTARGD